MEFQNVTPSQVLYVETVLGIIRSGIRTEHPKLLRNSNEDNKNQQLAEQFDMVGRTTDPVICCQKEHKRKSGSGKEDLYFFIPNDERTRVFYCECKRLPKYRTKTDEEYVVGNHANGSISGGIQRYKLGLHGEPNRLRDNGMIGYVESRTVESWKHIINQRLILHYPEDGILEPKANYPNEFVSKHDYDCKVVTGEFTLHHFLIDLTGKE